MPCTRCDDVREVWDATDKTYYPCRCVSDEQERGPHAAPLEDRCFGPLHDDALRIYAAMLTGIVSRADTRLEEITTAARVDLMTKALADAWGLRHLMAHYEDRKKEPPK